MSTSGVGSPFLQAILHPTGDRSLGAQPPQSAPIPAASLSTPLTLGYAIFIIAFIRVGEKLLQRFGPRKPMIWGSLIVIVACLLLMSTNLLIGRYVILAPSPTACSVSAWRSTRHHPPTQL